MVDSNFYFEVKTVAQYSAYFLCFYHRRFLGIGTLIVSQDVSAQVIEASSPPKEPLYITLLGSEWNSLGGGLSTLNREFAIHLAQKTNVRVSLLVPEGARNYRDKKEAQTLDECC